MIIPKKLCPYCGNPVYEEICSHCGSHSNPNRQYYDPMESAWQVGRFLRKFKYGKLIVGIKLLGLLYLISLSL